MKNLFVTLIGIIFMAGLSLSIAPILNASTTQPSEINTFQEVKNLTSPMVKGQAIYEGKGTCYICHQLTGTGLPPAFPPLANANYLLEDKDRAIRQTMYGSTQPITVNGLTYPGGTMTIVELTDEEVMNVVNYILNSWGNNGGTVSLEEVSAQRQ